MQGGTFSPLGHPRETGLRGDVFASTCPTRLLLDRIADKWSVLILMTLKDGPARFSGLKRKIGGVSQKMLSQTLKSLERDGLITRAVEPTVPVTVTYTVTPLGQALMSSFRSMIEWAETRMPDVAASQRAYDARAANL